MGRGESLLEIFPGTAVAVDGVALLRCLEGVARVHGFVLLPGGGEVLVASHSAVGSAVVVEAPLEQLQPPHASIPRVGRTRPVVVALRR